MLLDELKNYLRITWDDEDTELTKLYERGQKTLNRIIGVELNYELDDIPKGLLFDWCRYQRNNSAEFFLNNFAEDILFLQLDEAVKESDSNE